MQRSKRGRLPSRSNVAGKLSALALAVGAIVLLQGCGRNYSQVGYGNGPLPNATLVAINITPSTALLQLAGTRQLFATGVYSDGTSIDISPSVTWAASSPPSTTSNVSVTSTGIATGSAIGQGIVTATLGPVTGTLQLIVSTDGFASTSIGVLVVPYKNTEVDAAYLAESQSLIQGAYAVQEVNLDADQFSSVLPVPNALLASIPMPSGFVPNATAASSNLSDVAVISYSSPEVVVIDASNDPALDPSSNTVIGTYTAPITKKVTFNGRTCMICAAVVNPVDGSLLLSTSQGYYSMDLTTGAFTALNFSSEVFPAQSFVLNPTATEPYILSPTFGSNGVQLLNLKTNAVTNNTNFGLTTPSAAAIDLSTNYSAVVESDTTNQTLVDLTNPESPVVTPVPDLGVCGQPAYLNMLTIGKAASIDPSTINSTLYTSQASGSCIGLQTWPFSGVPLQPIQILYGYGIMPATPDGAVFLNGADPNAITSFSSVVNKKNFGVLVSANPKASQNWIAKINASASVNNVTLNQIPGGGVLTNLTAGAAGDGVIYLPAPATAATLSLGTLNFGSVNVGTATSALPVTLTYIGTNANAVLNVASIAIQGTNAADFFETDNCAGQLTSLSSCVINVSFTPSLASAESATLVVTDDGGTALPVGCTASAGTQAVCLSGAGTAGSGSISYGNRAGKH